VHNLARGNNLEAGSTRGKKGGKERKNVRNSVWQFGTENRKCRWRARVHPGRKSEVGAVQSALGVGGCGCEILVLAMCPLRFAKAGSAATLSEHIKATRKIKLIGFICTVVI